MRRLTLVLVVLATLLAACDPGIEITIVNNTERALCWYERESDIGREKWCADIGAGETISYTALCTSRKQKLVILTVGVDGDRIYERSATCGQWEKSGATVTIEERAGQFVVTDSLGEE